jgi:curved DNA-binding protein CbpA
MLPAGKPKPIEILHRLLLLGVLKVERVPEAGQQKAASSRILEELETQINDLLARFEVANYYEILSVPADASEDQIHTAYHDLARQYHPDRFESREHGASLRSKAEQLFTHITGAYKTLSSSAARANYDEQRKTRESQVEAAVQGRATADVETEKMAETLFRAGCASLTSKDFEKAAQHLKESVFLRPDVAKYQLYLGVAQAAIPRFMKEAEQHLLRALQLDPMRVEGHIELGKLYLKVNLPKRAETQFLEVLRWDPENRTARRLLDEVSKGQTREGGPGRRSKSSLSR